MSSPFKRRTRREFLGLFGAGLGALTFAACGGSDDPASGMPAPSPTVHLPDPPSGDASLEAMIGQMLMLGFRGYSIEAGQPIHAEIAAGRAGNVVLFDFDVPSMTAERNVQSPQQVAALTGQVQSLSPARQLIAIDQEGGLVARLKPSTGFPPTLSPEELAALDDLQETRRRAAEMARTLAAAGVNLNLAPVVDVNVNPDNPIIGAIERSFSPDPDVVAEQALAFIQGHHDEGVLCTLKHFPGHGSSEDDSHLGFVDVTPHWSDLELIPFRRVIEAGMADAVMTAHIFNSNLDPDYPATLSRRTITGVLREQLGFEGVIITDDMQMGAIANYYSFDESVEVAVQAGADIIAIANNSVYEPEIGDKAFSAIMAAVRAGRISEERIKQSYDRIVALKARLRKA